MRLNLQFVSRDTREHGNANAKVLDAEGKVRHYTKTRMLTPNCFQTPSSEFQETRAAKSTAEVTAEQLSGALRVDSYFAPCLLPRTTAVVRLANLNVHLHNSLPAFTR